MQRERKHQTILQNGARNGATEWKCVCETTTKCAWSNDTMDERDREEICRGQASNDGETWM